MNLLKALATTSSMTLLSRILGYVRDTSVAVVFGAGLATDAFMVATKIPNFLRRLFAEGAFSQAFVPILGEYKSQRSADELRDLIDYVSGMLALVLFVVAVIGVLAAPYIIYISAPGFAKHPEKFALTVDLLRITFPYILFISLTGLAGGILNTFGRFMVPAFTPVLLNVSAIVFTLWLTPYFDPPAKALAWGVFVGGVLQLAFQVPFLLRLKVMPRFKLNFRHEGVRRVLRQMGPALFGVSVGQISLLLNVFFASFLVTGSVTWLYYADRLMEFPAGMLGVALGTILLPSLSRHFASGADKEYTSLLDWGLRLVLLLALPCAAALLTFSQPLVATLYHYGAFTDKDVQQTTLALTGYGVGLLGLVAIKVLAPGFYASQDIQTPVRIAVVVLCATQVLNFFLVPWLSHAGLAWSIGLGALLNAAWLLMSLMRKGSYQPLAGWGLFALRVLLATALLTGFLIYAAQYLPWLAWRQEAGWRLAAMAGVLVASGIVYFGCLWLSGLRWQSFVRR